MEIVHIIGYCGSAAGKEIFILSHYSYYQNDHLSHVPNLHYYTLKIF